MLIEALKFMLPTLEPIAAANGLRGAVEFHAIGMDVTGGQVQLETLVGKEQPATDLDLERVVVFGVVQRPLRVGGREDPDAVD